MKFKVGIGNLNLDLRLKMVLVSRIKQVEFFLYFRPFHQPQLPAEVVSEMVTHIADAVLIIEPAS